MPGSVDGVSGRMVRGWARHPRHASYIMTVHALVQGQLVGTALAGLSHENGGGFEVYLPQPSDPAQLQIVLGETDEYLPVPHTPPPRRMLTVEDLIATAARRPWVTGATDIDAERAGLLPETIIDLHCRDYLNRRIDPTTAAAALRTLQSGQGYDAVRRMLIGTLEYRDLRIYADRLPGAIFSQKMVMAAARNDFSG